MPIMLERTAGPAERRLHVRPACLARRLESAATRYGLYALLAGLLAVTAMTGRAIMGPFDFLTSDGRWYYAYLPSLVIDGDLDFRNQIREHWDKDPRPPLDVNLTDRGLVKNKYTIGVSLTLLPSFLVGHAAALGLYALTSAPWCARTAIQSLIKSVIWFYYRVSAPALMLIDRLLTRRFRIPPVPTFLAVVTFWLGTHFLWYYVREPYMAHLAGTFWVTASVALVAELLSDMDQGRLPGWRVFLLTFATTMALVCRPSNAFLAPFGIYLLYRVIRAGMVGACSA